MASNTVSLEATARPRAGKGAARQARRDDKIPGVIYGDNQPPTTIALDYKLLWKQIQKGKFLATVVELNLDGKMNRVLPRDVQYDPVKDTPLHVDFLRIGKDGVIRVKVPVRFVNEALSPGLKRGGVLNIVRHEVEVFCQYDKIPAQFEASLEGLEIGRSIHISAFNLPGDVKPVIRNRDFTVATIAGAVKPEEEAPAPGAAAPAAGAAPAAAAGGKAPAAAAAKGAPAKGGDAKAAAPAAGGKAAPAKPAAKK